MPEHATWVPGGMTADRLFIVPRAEGRVHYIMIVIVALSRGISGNFQRLTNTANTLFIVIGSTAKPIDHTIIYPCSFQPQQVFQIQTNWYSNTFTRV